MANEKQVPGENQLTGWKRPIWMGVLYGAGAMAVFHLVCLVAGFNMAYMIWGLFNFVVFEGPLGALAGSLAGYGCALLLKWGIGRLPAPRLLSALLGAAIFGVLIRMIWVVMPLVGSPWLISATMAVGAFVFFFLTFRREPGRTAQYSRWPRSCA